MTVVSGPARRARETPGPVAPITRRRWTWRLRWLRAVPLLGPAGLLLGGLLIFPVGFTVYLALTNAELVGPTAAHYSFTGAANLHQLAADTTFRHSGILTVIFVLGSALGSVLVGLVMAVLLQRAPRPLARLATGVAIIAWMLPAVTAAMLWYAFSTQGGTVSILLRSPSFNLLTSQPLLTVVLAMVWSTAGFSMLLVSAGLRHIPEEVLEAADVEGASPATRFRLVTLPLLRPTLVTATLLSAILSVSNFALVFVMTQGGPGTATDILPIYSYQQAFNYYHLAYGALIGLVIVVIATALGVIYVRAVTRNR